MLRRGDRLVLFRDPREDLGHPVVGGHEHAAAVGDAQALLAVHLKSVAAALRLAEEAVVGAQSGRGERQCRDHGGHRPQDPATGPAAGLRVGRVVQGDLDQAARQRGTAAAAPFLRDPHPLAEALLDRLREGGRRRGGLGALRGRGPVRL